MEEHEWADEEYEVCECELDWRCGLHKHHLYTPLEEINDRYASEQSEIDRMNGQF